MPQYPTSLKSANIKSSLLQAQVMSSSNLSIFKNTNTQPFKEQLKQIIFKLSTNVYPAKLVSQLAINILVYVYNNV